MKAGDLNQLIKIIRRKSLSSDFGTKKQETEMLAAAWASVVPLRGDEQIEAQQQVVGKTFYKVTVRWSQKLDELNSSMWIEYRHLRLEISSIANLNEMNEFIEMVCVESDR